MQTDPLIWPPPRGGRVGWQAATEAAHMVAAVLRAVPNAGDP